MKIEVHITSKEIEKLFPEFLHIQNLSPDLKVVNEVKLSEYVIDIESLEDALCHLTPIILKAFKGNIQLDRIKLECEPNYKLPILYYECHYKYDPFYLGTNLPLSRNVKSGKFIQTFRASELSDFPSSSKKIEQCVFDTNVEEDIPWLSSWENCF